MKNVLLRIGNQDVLLPSESGMVVFKILQEESKFFNHYDSNIDCVLIDVSKDSLNLSPAPNKIEENVAAAKAIGATYYDFVRNSN